MSTSMQYCSPERIERSKRQGDLAEEWGRRALASFFKSEANKSTIKQDVYGKWDATFLCDGEHVKVDFKSEKNNINGKCLLEFVGITGYDGWMLGKADYILFQRSSSTGLLVHRATLCERVLKHKPIPFARKNGRWVEPEGFKRLDRRDKKPNAVYYGRSGLNYKGTTQRDLCILLDWKYVERFKVSGGSITF